MVVETTTNEALPIFISCAPTEADQVLLQLFEKHLKLLKRQKLISVWHYRLMSAGANRQHEAESHFVSAKIIMLLVSADFFNNDVCEYEMEHAFARSETGDALVIPILLQPVNIDDTPIDRLVCLPRNDQPVALWENKDQAFSTIVGEVRKVIKEWYTGQQRRHVSEREQRLHALLADHRHFLHDRLKSFVGRRLEIADIRQRIEQQMQTGGYVTITGQAGQGKSSIMAKLVAEFGPDTVAYHFIPFNPGPDHQVGLLRNLMTRLLLKYDLTELYVATDHRAALRDYFPNVLREVAARGGQEVIFIDGLDQIEEDLNGIRDLTFLPTNPPTGIVFVLATRPNDALYPLTF